MVVPPVVGSAMSTTITDDAVGNDVVDAEGEKIGIVSAVKHGAARVDPDPGLTDKFKAKLDWEDADAADFPLQEEAIDTVTDDEIRLQYAR
jgi:hypothetical protein